MKKVILTLAVLTTIFTVSCSKFPVSTTVGTLNVTHGSKGTCVSDEATLTLDSLNNEYHLSSKFTDMIVTFDPVTKTLKGKAEICIPDSVFVK